MYISSQHLSLVKPAVSTMCPTRLRTIKIDCLITFRFSQFRMCHLQQRLRGCCRLQLEKRAVRRTLRGNLCFGLPDCGASAYSMPPTGFSLWSISMDLEIPKQALAAREAHEALIELKKIVDEATRMTHAAELESFSAAVHHDEDISIRRSLQDVIKRVKSRDFDKAVFEVREKLETALSTLIQRRGLLGRRTARDNIHATSRKVGTLRIFVARFSFDRAFPRPCNGPRLALGRL